MNKPFLFIDFYKTLSFDHLWSNHSASQYISDAIFCEENQVLINEWMRGRQSAENIVTYLSKSTGLPELDLWESLISSASGLLVLEEVVPLIVQAKEKYRTVLFTDNFDTFTRFTVPNNNFYTLFDDIVNSADTGLLKCDLSGKAFLDVAGEMITDSILIDDSPSSKETFEALGGKVFQVGEPELTIEALMQVLSFG